MNSVLIMNRKTAVQYVYFKSCWEEKCLPGRKSWRIHEASLGTFKGIIVEKIRKNRKVKNPGKNKDMEIVRLMKLMNKYDYSNAVIWADSFLTEYFEMTDIMFQARKQEFIGNLSFILNSIQKRAVTCEDDNGRENAAIVIDSDEWSTRELFAILTAVKNYYREINVVAHSPEHLGIKRIKEVMYDEWGVVINIFEREMQVEEIQNLVLFLVKEFTESVKGGIQWHNAYLVSEKETLDYHREREKLPGMGKIYSGLMYQAGEILPYDLMVNMAWQKPILFKNFHVSVVDIYALE